LNEDKIQLKLNEIHQKYSIECKRLLSEMKYPLPSSEFDDYVQHQILHVLEEILFTLGSKLLEGKDAIEFVETAKKSLRDHVDNYRGKNLESIRKFYDELVGKAVKDFSDIIRKEWNQRSSIKPSVLDKLQKQAFDEVLLAFESETKKFASENIAEAMKSHLKQQIKTQYDKMEEENSRLASLFIKQHSEELLAHLKTRTGPESIQMPLFDNDLNEKLQDAVTEVIKKFESLTLEYAVYSCFQPLYQQFKKDVHSLCDLRRRENIDAFAREVTQPIETSVKVILHSESNYNTVFSFKQFIRTICLINLDDGIPKTWPIELKLQIIDNMIRNRQEIQDLIRKKEGLWSTFWGFVLWVLSSLGLYGEVSVHNEL
jgi:hypothetical protein